MNKTDETSGVSRVEPGFWRIQLVRLANLFAGCLAASALFIFVFPDRVALVASMGGILGVTLALGPRSWQIPSALSWRRLGLALAILDALAVLLGRLAGVFSAAAFPLDDAVLGVFGVSALAMAIGAVPLFTQLFPRAEPRRKAGEAAAREPEA
ncbi:MAG: hypothetical protein JSU82_16430 [Rhodospirillales bacterium]|nr:MAG: hypothetical protein JSU82_16430 [Rhodospirillales bacterium]